MSSQTYPRTPDSTEAIPCEWWEDIERERTAEVYSWERLPESAARQLARLGLPALAKYANQPTLFADMEDDEDYAGRE